MLLVLEGTQHLASINSPSQQRTKEEAVVHLDPVFSRTYGNESKFVHRLSASVVLGLQAQVTVTSSLMWVLEIPLRLSRLRGENLQIKHLPNTKVLKKFSCGNLGTFFGF